MYDCPAQHASFAHKFTGKERDSESNLDNFGARYNSSAMGRFMSPDPSPLGLDLFDPQSWNLYSYVRNRPTGFIDNNGRWATDVHAQITTFALQNYVSAGELQILVSEQYAMDRDQSDQSHHAMAVPGQTAPQAIDAWQKYVDSEMNDVSQELTPSGNFTSDAVRALGDAIHTLQDTTSPMHTSPNGDPRVWYGTWHVSSLEHVLGEMSPAQDWPAIKQSLALSMAARLQSGAACETGKRCLTEQNFQSELNRNYTDYVNWYYTRAESLPNTDPVLWEEQRQCALGNPAACP